MNGSDEDLDSQDYNQFDVNDIIDFVMKEDGITEALYTSDTSSKCRNCVVEEFTKRKRERKGKSKMNNTSSRFDRTSKDGSVLLSPGNKDKNSNNNEECLLLVSNMPLTWTITEKKKYIKEQCGSVGKIELCYGENFNVNTFKVIFPNKAKCEEAMSKLCNHDMDGIDIAVEMIPSHSHKCSKNFKDEDINTWRPDLDVWDIDPKGLYGLRLSYLKSLGIEPPIDKWVAVSNVRCEKAELRDVMEIAGHVLILSICMANTKEAKVMYSHPLEAVQAISMLNGQTLCGHIIKVEMHRSPTDTIILPKGLSNVGLGLGVQGRPLRNIMKHFERFFENKASLMDPMIFDDPNVDGVLDTSDPLWPEAQRQSEFIVRNVEEFVELPKETEPPVVVPEVKETIKTEEKKSTQEIKKTDKGTDMHNDQNMQTGVFVPAPTASGAMPGHMMGHGYAMPHFHPSCHMMAQGMMAYGHGFIPGPAFAIPHYAQPDPRTVPGAFVPRPPGQRGQAPRALNPLAPQFTSESIVLQISNLPAGSTFPQLVERLASCGPLLALQLTAPGQAQVTYGHLKHAQMCYMMYHGLNVDGCIIDVKFI